MLIYTASIVIVALIATSCGASDSSCDSQGKCDASTSTASTATTATTTTDFVIRGSINSAFALTVDGKDYDDIEGYFTAENARLPSKVEAAGYTGYTVRFDAAIGFNDLTQGMTVYIAGKEKRGYQTKTLIAKNDTFAAKLPVEAAGDVYQIKASKRINVILTKDKEIKKFCYNFAAVDLEVPYEIVDSPVILSNFKSSLTAYECQQDAGSDSLQVPENSDKPAEYTTVKATSAKVTIYDNLRNQIKSGMTEDQLYGLLNSANSDLTIWSHSSIGGYLQLGLNYSEAGGMCEAEVSKVTQDCFFVIDDNNKVLSQQGIRLEYLAPGESWPTFEEIKTSIVIYDSLRGKIKPGMTKAVATQLIGSADKARGDLYVEPQAAADLYKIFYKFNANLGVCEIEIPNTLRDCYIGFDTNGIVTTQSNIRSVYLAPGSIWPIVPAASASDTVAL